MDHGQGHGTTFKQVLSDKLGLDADLIRYQYGDTDLVTQGIGTFGSRSAMLAGSAIVVAADKLIDKGKKIAAHMMEAAVGDIAFERGRFTIAGTDRSVGIGEVGIHSFHWEGAAERHRGRLHRTGELRATERGDPSPSSVLRSCEVLRSGMKPAGSH